MTEGIFSGSRRVGERENNIRRSQRLAMRGLAAEGYEPSTNEQLQEKLEGGLSLSVSQSRTTAFKRHRCTPRKAQTLARD